MSGITIVEFEGNMEGKYDLSDLPKLFEMVQRNAAILAPTEEMSELLNYCSIVCIDPLAYRGNNIDKVKKLVGGDSIFTESEGRRVRENGRVFIYAGNRWFRPANSFIIDSNVAWVRIYVPKNGG